MKKKKYLPLYYKWLESGIIPYRQHGSTSGGLCSIFTNDKLLERCLPIDGTSWYCGFTTTDWRYGRPEDAFTPTRKNILLLMAAMNNEL